MCYKGLPIYFSRSVELNYEPRCGRDTNYMEVRRKYIFGLLAIGMALFFFNLGGRDLWEPDETRYAVIAREMKETGSWILPHFNGEIYSDKPPLFFWLVNLSTFLLNENTSFSNRLPSALAGLGTVLLTFLFGSKLFNPRVGLFSSLILATCVIFPQISRWMMLDSLFTLLFLLTLYHFYVGYGGEGRRCKYYLLAGLFMGLGVLTKGPGAYLAIPIFLVFSLFQKDLKKFWNRDLLWSFLISLGVIFAWLIPALWIGGGDFGKEILSYQIIGRLAGKGKYSHPNPFYFYFIRFPLEFFPWIVFLPSAFISGLREGRVKRKEFLFLFIWFILIFLFFTLSKGKKDNYILPLYPAAAMFVGWLWDSKISSPAPGKETINGLILLIFLFLIAFVLFLSGFPQELYPDFQPYTILAVSVIFYLLVGSILCLLLFFKKKEGVSFVILVIFFVFLHLHLSYAIPLKLNPQRSMRAFSERMVKRMEKGDDLKICLLNPSGLIYYTQRTYIEDIRRKDRFFEILHSPQRVFIVINGKAFDFLKRELNIEINPIEQVREGSWNYVLISNH